MAPAAPPLVLDDFLPYRLSVASNLVSDAIARAYEALFGLSIPEWRVVAVVAEAGEITPQAIGALTARGLLARAGHPGDRRSHLLSLTAAGHALYAQVAPEALALEARLLATFTPAEVADLTAKLRRLEAAALALDA